MKRQPVKLAHHVNYPTRAALLAGAAAGLALGATGAELPKGAPAAPATAVVQPQPPGGIRPAVRGRIRMVEPATHAVVPVRPAGVMVAPPPTTNTVPPVKPPPITGQTPTVEPTPNPPAIKGSVPTVAPKPQPPQKGGTTPPAGGNAQQKPPVQPPRMVLQLDGDIAVVEP